MGQVDTPLTFKTLLLEYIVSMGLQLSAVIIFMTLVALKIAVLL